MSDTPATVPAGSFGHQFNPNGVASIDCSHEDPAMWTWLTADGLAPDGEARPDLPFGPKQASAISRTATKS